MLACLRSCLGSGVARYRFMVGRAAHCMTWRWLGERCCLGWFALLMSRLFIASFSDKCMTVCVSSAGSAPRGGC